jgi:hypothetical protein
MHGFSRRRCILGNYWFPMRRMVIDARRLLIVGYTDIQAEIDLSTFRRIPWENDIPFFLVKVPEWELTIGVLF